MQYKSYYYENDSETALELLKEQYELLLDEYGEDDERTQYSLYNIDMITQ